MKKILAIAFVLCGLNSIAQYGNEWIDYSRQHFYFKIHQDGLYRISHTTMQNAGVPVGSIAPQDFKMFGKEKELYIHVEDGGDGIFDDGDYIEFYAQRNNGWLDSLLYDNPINIGNPAYSLVNDTLTYYLTWDASTTNRRMIVETDVDYSAFIPSAWFWRTVIHFFSDIYFQGFRVLGLSRSTYERGEGWFGGERNAAASNASDRILDVDLQTHEPFIGGPDAEVYAISASNNDANPGTLNHHLQLKYRQGSVYQTMIDTMFSSYQQNNLFFYLPNADLEPTTRIRHELVNDLGVPADRQGVSYIQMRYPRNTNVSGLSRLDFEIEPLQGQSKTRLSFTGVTMANPMLLVLTGPSRRIPLVDNGGIYEALIPNHPAGISQKCLLIDAGQVQQIGSLTPIEFENFAALSPDSAYVILTHHSLWTSAQTYANYRSSAAGGNREVVLIDVNQLFHQYGGGVYKNAIGIRRFVDHMFSAWPNPPAELFLLGKSIQEANVGNQGARKNHAGVAFEQSLVPTMGFPPSDNMITSVIQGMMHAPAVATGRLAAKSNQNVLDYLSKVMEYEAEATQPVYNKPNKEWMKKALHFSGGSNIGEQTLFRYYLALFDSSYSSPYLGGTVETFQKTTSDPISPADFLEIKQRLENGVGLMTFFGHAAVNGFDQSVDAPINWNNQGKYPFLIGNSCYTGDLHLYDYQSASEEFVLIPNRGVIGFLASNKVGFSNGLFAYTYELYKQFSKLQYGKSMAYCVKKNIETMQQFSGNLTPTHLTTMQMMTLHGDPAIKLYNHDLPEYDITQNDIIISPANVTMAVDTMRFGVIVTNLGKGTDDPVNVNVLRYFPGGEVDTFFTTIPHVYFKDTVWFSMPVKHNIAGGINQFHVMVDIPSYVDEEYDESGNNQLMYTLPLFFEGIMPVWPYKFAIVPNDSIVLKASTINPLAPSKAYRFEIDTTDFIAPASPFRRYQVIQSAGGVVEAFPNDWISMATGVPAPLTLTDSTVYFWRVSVDSVNAPYTEFSFQYIPNKRGWGQAHFYQFKDNHHSVVEYDRDDRQWTFGEIDWNLYVEAHDHSSSAYDFNYTWYEINGNVGEYGVCFGTGVPSIHVAVINPLTMESWVTNYAGLHPQWDFGNDMQCSNSRGRAEGWFIFRQDNPAQMDSLYQMLANKIPCGYWVIIFPEDYPDYTAWNSYAPNLANLLTSFGASNVSLSANQLSWILTFRMCVPSTMIETYATSLNDTLSIARTIQSFDYKGFQTASLMGPAQEWHSLHWQQHAQENPTTDSTRIKLYGVRHDGVQVLLYDDVMTNLDSVLDLPFNIGLDAATYPFARLQAYLEDTIATTPAQIDRWQLLYTPIPEAALNPKKGYYFSLAGDTLNEGESLRFAMAIENISDMPMDSLLVHYWVEDKDRNRNYIAYPRQDSLHIGQVFLDTVTLNTQHFAGLNSFWIEVNPYLNGIKDQPEQYHFNNLAQKFFYANADGVNPILDVTFDGVHILDGELISAKPFILITLKDENPWLVLNEDADTINFQIWLTDPMGNQRRIYFNQGGQELMRFHPATTHHDKFKIEFPAELTLDGRYELFVQAQDKSGNKSGDVDYKIRFEVVNQMTITEVLNYPNPFSTSTRFVFVITGSQLPDYMEIQILTITGKMVRQIRMDELGALRIGKNITEFAWDGTDEFGDRLANGVYLYQVITRFNDESVEYRATEVEKFFKKGVGKMYLMR